MTLPSSLAASSLIVCVGPGGVGKTTTSAALALTAARAGRSALVLTIDPAKRLADALGISDLDDTIRSVPITGLQEGGRLDAAMLDTRASYDALIGRIARSSEERERILANRAYRAFSRTLARSHAYVAMERLYHVVEEGGYDLIVLDTPPARSALEILDAPGRLARFLDERVLGLFLDRAESGARAGSRLLKALGALTGTSALDELLSFFTAFAGLRGGFRHRAAAVADLLHAPTTAFVLVASAQTTSLADAAFLREDLAARGVAPRVVIFGRGFVPEPGSPAEPVRAMSPSPHPLAEVRAIRARFVAVNVARDRAMRAFLEAAPNDVEALSVAELAGDIRDLESLGSMLEHAVPL